MGDLYFEKGRTENNIIWKKFVVDSQRQSHDSKIIEYKYIRS
jgi:hypothetical protein